MRRVVLPLLLFLLSVCVSCTPEATLTFSTRSAAIPLRKTVHENGDDSTVYDLAIDQEVVMGREPTALSLQVAGGYASVNVTLYDEDELVYARSVSPLPISLIHNFLIPVPSGVQFDAIRAEVFDPGTDFEVLQVGLADRSFGIGFGDTVEIDVDVVYDISETGRITEHIIDFPPVDLSMLTDREVTGIEVRYEYTSSSAADFPTDEPITIELSNGPETTSRYRLNPHPGGGSVYLYRASIGFQADVVRIISENSRFRLQGVFLTMAPASPVYPVPADFSTIIGYSMAEWRRDEYEIFRWTRYPSILVYDTRDYQTQSVLFLRLAFFVEKPGYAGKVLTNEELAGRHGWNAHDYRAIDLARFFTEAPDAVLNDLEIELRETLVREGVIRPDLAGYAAGEGGIISISQESTRYLRNLFMAHEGSHGVFFADEGYRNLSFSIWASLDERERLFWRRFFASRFYNSDDEFLMVNEFQAYLIQQPLERVVSYFRGWAVPRFKMDMPGWWDFADEFLRDYPDTFYRAARIFANSTWEGARVHLRSLYCLEPLVDE